MIRRMGLVFVVFASLSASYAIADDKPPLSPTMQCLVDCRGWGFDLPSCINWCVD